MHLSSYRTTFVLGFHHRRSELHHTDQTPALSPENDTGMRPRHQSAPCVLDPSARQESPPSVVPKPQHSPKRALSPIVIHRAPAPPHWRRSCWRCDPHVLRARICPPRTHTPRGCCRWHGSADLRRHAARWRPAIKKTFLCGQRRQCPISSHQQFGRRDCAQHSATRPPGEMSVFSTDLAHGRYHTPRTVSRPRAS